MKRIGAAILIVLLIGALRLANSADGEAWTARELRIFGAFNLDAAGPVPPSPSNRVADNPAAALLGKKIFFDTGFGKDQSFSCASCHNPALDFTDGKQRSIGAGKAMRNSQPLLSLAYSRWFYWDGRRDSLWSQALIPFEAADEMGASRVSVLRRVVSEPDYLQAYTELFGLPPKTLDFARLPDEAGPFGGAELRNAWQSLDAKTQESINAMYANIGKVIAAYERTLLHPKTKFDRYAEAIMTNQPPAPTDAFSEAEKTGARLFFDAEKTQCLQCHNGPQFRNGGFHNVGSGNFTGAVRDYGRMFGLRVVLMDEFNCIGPHSDAALSQCDEYRFMNKDGHIPLAGAFKVPTLRGLSKTGPYFHDGRFSTLAEVLAFYNQPPEVAEVGPHELRPMALTEVELEALEAFLLTLSIQ